MSDADNLSDTSIVNSVPGLSPPQDIERSNPIGYWERRVTEALQGVEIKTDVKAPAPTPWIGQDPFAFVYNLPVKEGRGFIGSLSHETKKIKGTPAIHLWQLRASAGSVTRRFISVRQSDYTQSEAMAICRLMTDALNRWPDMNFISIEVPKKGVPPAISKVLFAAAQASVCPQLPVRALAPGIEKGPANQAAIWGVGTHLTYIDPETYNIRREKRYYYRMDDEVPEVSGIVFSHDQGHSYQGPDANGAFRPVDTTDVSLDAAGMVQLRRCERLVRQTALAWGRQCPLMSKSDMKLFFDNVRRQFMSVRHRQDSIFNNAALCNAFNTFGGKQLRASEVFAKHVSPAMPSMWVNSWDLAWTQLVKDVGESTWMATSDLYVTWIAMAKAVDDVNRRIGRGEDAPGACHCTPTESLVTLHPCSHCGSSTICNTLHLGVWGVRECDKCRKSPARSTEKMSYQVAKHRCRTIIKKDCVQCSINPNSGKIQSIITAVENSLEVLLRGLEGTSYMNGFSGQQIDCPPQWIHPLSLSIDAVFPLGVTTSGETFIHAPDNVIIVPLALNYCKGIHLPIFLQTISDYYRAFRQLEQGIDIGDKDAVTTLITLQQELVKDCRRFADIRMKAGWKHEQRTGLAITPEEYAYYREEWVSGKFHPGSSTEFVRRYISTRHHVSEDPWENSIADIIVREIEDWTGVSLPRRNGCPYFAHPKHIPTNWNWSNCRRLFLSR